MQTDPFAAPAHDYQAPPGHPRVTYAGDFAPGQQQQQAPPGEQAIQQAPPLLAPLLAPQPIAYNPAIHAPAPLRQGYPEAPPGPEEWDALVPVFEGHGTVHHSEAAFDNGYGGWPAGYDANPLQQAAPLAHAYDGAQGQALLNLRPPQNSEVYPAPGLNHARHPNEQVAVPGLRNQVQRLEGLLSSPDIMEALAMHQRVAHLEARIAVIDDHNRRL